MQPDNKPTKRRSTFAVLFYINRTKVRKDGMCQLLCKISIDAASEQIGTKVKVDPALWNPTTGRADGKSRNASEVNRAIDRLTEIIRSHYERIRRDLGFVTAEAVKNAVKGIGQKPTMLLALFREHNEEFGKRVGIDRTKETLTSYGNSYNHLAAFVRKEYAAEDIALRSLDATFYDAFDLFLRTERGLGLKAVHEHLYRLKKMTRRAVGQGTLRCDPYRDLHPELPKRTSRHLKSEDLERLLAEPVADPELQRARDWFIFSTFTGLAYADLRRLSARHIERAEDGSLRIRIRRQKTDTESVVPLLELPRRILEKYRAERTDERLLPICSYHKLQKLMPRLGAFYGIEHLTFHKARHNFGTHITLSLGVPIETVSRMMGHKRIVTTQIYAHVTDRKVEEDMRRLKNSMREQLVELCDEQPTGKPVCHIRRSCRRTNN
ncbi:site-specific integrase [Alistipes timonensis]|uniref:site-specific integrase n=1 Tax=Alistipes timonensis TaxID=1465754 RepID=UPI00214D0FE8|nr:site-specific integrase [Alistipes timonensis]MCR2031558.1 site-specific integrase [Alistipes timonensis]